MYRHHSSLPHNTGLKSLFESFKHTELSGSLTALYSNRILQQVGGGLIGMFFPIMLYKVFGYDFYKVCLYYLASWSIWVVTIPIGAKMMSKLGMKFSMMLSVVVGWGWYFAAREFEMSSVWLWLGLVILSVNLYRMLYWVPYHTDFAKFSNKKTRGKQLAFLAAIASIVSIFIPMVSGFIITAYGYSVLYILAVLIFVLSIIPLFLIPNVKENYTYGYWRTYKELFRKSHRGLLLSYGADGMQSMVGVIVWPIFIWMLLNQSYQAVGIWSSLIVLVSVVAQLIMGDLADKYDKRKLMKLGTILNSIGWMIKIFVATGFQIFIASSYHSFATIVMRTPFDALMYDQAADSGHYVDEYTVLRELALTLGRLLMLGLIAFSFFVTGSLIGAFFLAALAALIINAL
jgi:MFS family permease